MILQISSANSVEITQPKQDGQHFWLAVTNLVKVEQPSIELYNLKYYSYNIERFSSLFKHFSLDCFFQQLYVLIISLSFENRLIREEFHDNFIFFYQKTVAFFKFMMSVIEFKIMVFVLFSGICFLNHKLKNFKYLNVYVHEF